jgi:NADH:ubiquinone oxidoreductase subunit H
VLFLTSIIFQKNNNSVLLNNNSLFKFRSVVAYYTIRCQNSLWLDMICWSSLNRCKTLATLDWKWSWVFKIYMKRATRGVNENCIGTFRNSNEIVMAQKQIWSSIPLFPVLVMFFISRLTETNRAPLDLP